MSIPDNYIGHSQEAAISSASQHTEAHLSQVVHIANSIVDECVAGIDIICYKPTAINNINPSTNHNWELYVPLWTLGVRVTTYMDMALGFQEFMMSSLSWFAKKLLRSLGISYPYLL